jgi:hypothetical protein
MSLHALRHTLLDPDQSGQRLQRQDRAAVTA